MIVSIYNKNNQFRKLINVVHITTVYLSSDIIGESKLYYLFIEPNASYKIAVEDVQNFEMTTILEKNTTYLLKARLFNLENQGEFTIKLIKRPIINDGTITTGTTNNSISENQKIFNAFRILFIIMHTK